MIITRTPLRVSFLGGGSDYPDFFENEPGYVLGTAINLYVYTAVVRHSSLADSPFKLTYRKNESVTNYLDFEHPSVRAILEFNSWEQTAGLHIATMADVPARTGLGSSSSFAVGLLQAIAALQDTKLRPLILAQSAIQIERNILLESGGWQDQCHAAFGGLNLFGFHQREIEHVGSVDNIEFIDYLNKRMVLISAGESRDSHGFALRTNRLLAEGDGRVIARNMANLAKSTYETIMSNPSIEQSYFELCRSVRESWIMKSQFSPPTPQVQNLIDTGLASGALAAKLCGAGGSGFVLFLLKNEIHEEFLSKFPVTRVQKIKVSPEGSALGPLNWNTR